MMEWIISGLVVIGVLGLFIALLHAQDNSDLFFNDLTTLGKVTRIIQYVIIIGGLLFLLTLCVKHLIFG